MMDSSGRGPSTSCAKTNARLSARRAEGPIRQCIVQDLEYRPPIVGRKVFEFLALILPAKHFVHSAEHIVFHLSWQRGEAR